MRRCRNILCGSTDFTADKIRSKVKSDKVACEFIYKLFLNIVIIAVNNHTVRNTSYIILGMSRTYPNCNGCLAFVNKFTSDLIRFYLGTDLIGSEIGAAAKNVIGIAAGMLDGLTTHH